VRLGGALRQLGHDVVGHAADDEMLESLAVELHGAARRISEGEPRARQIAGFHEHWVSELADGDPVPNWGDRPFSGPCSPWGLDPDVRRHGDGVIARVTFRSAHEGAPQRCHGGIVAGFFDDILGSVLGVIGEGAFTGELTIRYVAPVPLHRELVCLCRVDGRDGRKLYLTGEMLDGEQVLCRATSIFIQPKTAMTQSTFDPE
jgi:acyl-coenzyme A thioesterase PaaI-like protein